MTPIHHEVFFEIDSARKLAAELKSRRPGAVGEPAHERDTAADPAAEEAALQARAQDEMRASELARERAERKEKEREEARVDASENAARRARGRLEAAAIIEELAQARAEERAATEEALRKAGGEPVRYSWFPARGASQTWYFTSDGERRGPVTFGELRAMAARSVLDPRRDLIWKKGMEDWRPAGLIDGLFERNAFQEPSAKPAAPMKPVASPRSELLVEALASKNLVWPGAGRRGLWIGLLLFVVVWKPIVMFAAPHLAGRVGGLWMPELSPWVGLVPWLAIGLLLFNRLANLGMSRWWLAALAVPPLNFWVGFRCFICPPGYAYHRKMDRTGIALMVALALAVPAAVIAALWFPGVHSIDGWTATVRLIVSSV